MSVYIGLETQDKITAAGAALAHYSRYEMALSAKQQRQWLTSAIHNLREAMEAATMELEYVAQQQEAVLELETLYIQEKIEQMGTISDGRRERIYKALERIRNTYKERQ